MIVSDPCSSWSKGILSILEVGETEVERLSSLPKVTLHGWQSGI